MIDFDTESIAIEIERFTIFEQRLGRAIDTINDVPILMAKSIGARIRDTAKGMLGKYQSETVGPMGVYDAWEELHEETLERRASRGVNPEDQPLLETGDMRNVIQTSPPMLNEESVDFVIGYEATHPAAFYAVFHEIGTVNMEPRPVLGPAVIEVSDQLEDLIGPIVFNHFNVLAGNLRYTRNVGGGVRQTLSGGMGVNSRSEE